jgi:hypothetical protein
LIAGCLALAALGGCSSFRSKKRLEMGRFAEDMIALAGDIQHNLGQRQPVYLRDQFSIPEVDTLRMEFDRAKNLLRGVIGYSIQLVTVGDSGKPEPMKAALLADYLAEVLPTVLEVQPPVLDLSRAKVDTILTNVRSQEKFLAAIEAAQPLVDEVAFAADRIFDDTKHALDTALDAVRGRIEERYRDVRTADLALERRQIMSVFNIEYLGQIRRGVPGAVDSLIAREPSLAALVDASDGLDALEAQRIEDRMITILSRLREVRQQLQPDLEMYYRQQQELDELGSLWNSELRKANVAIVAWARGHKRIAQGVVDPADINVLGIARKASGSVIPLP